ncbi:uncharacterized protein MYCGRDRAFT_90973 [Zymoseptoria tritici IPO323]|uniref:Uncharacterized protein n=1 Tax=Zymoseptoria tritici (strain CBS 115943 / IPO323) TaxID=336722 RepID=F9X3V7_ZYMTI|nr:uncharacterized protein MYCGRDRAFT_90973 [Zymoseptoria tritici IPO323]EGP90046.1 hypothetical protein MYCGRDRAFT_90973 [Zymoseptoria tritici IPO323]
MEASLLGLPGEIKNRIYELVLTEGDDNTREAVELEQSWFDSAFGLIHVNRECIYPPEPLAITGLPLVSKTIRRESLRLYYSLNKFYFQTEYLKSKHKDRIVRRLEEWADHVGREQARDIRDVTISLASLKGQSGPASIDWDHMRQMRSLFHPHGCVRIRFCLDGNGTALFVLGSRASMLQELNRLAELWCWTWQRMRRYDEQEARRVAQWYRQDVAKLFMGMPETI